MALVRRARVGPGLFSPRNADALDSLIEGDSAGIIEKVILDTNKNHCIDILKHQLENLSVKAGYVTRPWFNFPIAIVSHTDATKAIRSFLVGLHIDVAKFLSKRDECREEIMSLLEGVYADPNGLYNRLLEFDHGLKIYSEELTYKKDLFTQCKNSLSFSLSFEKEYEVYDDWHLPKKEKDKPWLQDWKEVVASLFVRPDVREKMSSSYSRELLQDTAKDLDVITSSGGEALLQRAHDIIAPK